MKTSKITAAILLALVLGVSFAGVALSATPLEEAATRAVPNLNQTELFARIQLIANAIFTVLIVLSVFTIFIAAFQFVSSGDNADALSGARQKLIWAAVGIILALLAISLPTFLLNIINP
ncbi:MAG: hypothetical protein Q8Q38_02750 [bacterium]|nr:hypothetical protein [bacterium]